VGGLERVGEAVLAELEPADADEHQGVLRGKASGVLEGSLGLGVERGIGGLPDALEECQAEIPERGRVVEGYWPASSGARRSGPRCRRVPRRARRRQVAEQSSSPGSRGGVALTAGPALDGAEPPQAESA
jgi:hypothetical protein